MNEANIVIQNQNGSWNSFVARLVRAAAAADGSHEGLPVNLCVVDGATRVFMQLEVTRGLIVKQRG